MRIRARRTIGLLAFAPIATAQIVDKRIFELMDDAALGGERLEGTALGP